MIFNRYSAGRLASSKPKRCKRCGIKYEKIQGYCSDCLKVDAPEIKAIVIKHANETKANSYLGKVFLVISICLCIGMFLFEL